MQTMRLSVAEGVGFEVIVEMTRGQGLYCSGNLGPVCSGNKAQGSQGKEGKEKES